MRWSPSGCECATLLFACVWERLVRLSPLLITILGVAGMFQTYDGVLDSVFHVWLHVACVAHSEQGYVTSVR